MTTKNKDSRFWNKAASGYSKKKINNVPAYQHKLSVTQKYLTPDSHVVELGCGTGSTALIHAPYVKHILATDISDNMIAIAREKAQQQGVVNVDFETASAESLVLKEPVDTILALNILHLLENREQAIANIYNWLKPDGIFVTSTVCLGDSPSLKWLKVVFPLGRKVGLIPRVKVITQEHLISDFTNNGFVIDYQWQSGLSTFVVAKKKESGVSRWASAHLNN